MGIFNKIILGHGSGTSLMHDLIRDLFLKKLGNPALNKLTDSALIEFRSKRIAFTTDSFVVSPLFFKGGDIGKLCVCGTVNDLLAMGAVPRFISLAMILEEGLNYRILNKIVDSVSRQARSENVFVVTGDTKVVEKGACDKIFINTSGVGELLRRKDLSLVSIRPGDELIITGSIAEHGLSVLAGRKSQNFDFGIKSDCASLSKLILPLLKKTESIKFMRDPTRGGLATTLNEIAGMSGLGILINEKDIPISAKVKAACEILGLDPLYIANEGKMLLVVKKGACPRVLKMLKRHPLGKAARMIGTVVSHPRSKVLLNTSVAGNRILGMLSQESLPRIC